MSRRYIPRVILFICFFAPIVYFFGSLFHFSVNFPIRDDYGTILAFLVKFVSSGDAVERLRMVFSQYNEHRLVFNRAVTLLGYYATGSVDFRYLIFLGNLSLAVLTALLWRSSRTGDKPLYLLPLPFLIFQPGFHENMTWAMAALSNFWVYLFSFLSLYALLSGRGEARCSLAAAFALMAVFTQGNGLFALPMGAAVLLLQRRFKALLPWAALSAGVFAFYFRGYVQPGEHSSLLEAAKAPLAVIEYFFSLMGSPFPFPMLSGALLAALFALVTINGYYGKNPVVYSFLVFLFVTAIVTSAMRAGLGLETSLLSRYRIVPVLITAVLYVSLLETFPERKKSLFAALLTLSVVFNVSSWVENLRELELKRNELAIESFQWDSGVFFTQRTGKAESIIAASIEKGIFKPGIDPASIASKGLDAAPPPVQGEFDFAMNTVGETASHLIFYGWAYEEGYGRKEAAIVLTGPRSYRFETLPIVSMI